MLSKFDHGVLRNWSDWMMPYVILDDEQTSKFTIKCPLLLRDSKEEGLRKQKILYPSFAIY